MALSRGSRWFLGGCVVLVAGLGAGLLYLDGRIGGPDVEPGLAYELVVEPGTSVRAVGDELAAEGVVRSATRFRMAARDVQLDQHLRPGAYDLETGMGVDETVEALLDGPARAAVGRFTVPEGLAVELVLERLDEDFGEHDAADFRAVLDERTEAAGNEPGVLELPDWAPEPAERGDDVVEPYEGLLFPETYEVGPDAAPLEVLQVMVDQTATVISRVVEDTGTEVEPYQILTVASLVERETFVGEERDRVAGVIANRLADDMRLQIDATVLYARGEHTERVLHEDTEIDSPYNTYQVAGLPPTPIAAPGEASIRAAVEPEQHDFRFYVLADDCDGSHRFSETAAEHEGYVAELRAVDGCR